MISEFLEWFLSRPKYERVLFVIDVVLFLVFISALQTVLSSGASLGEVIL